MQNKEAQTYGYFDNAKKEYVITDPKTPFPWINYLGVDGFYSLVSNTGGGYTFYKDAKFRRLTRYRYNNIPMDSGGKYFYIADGDTCWSPSWKPMQTELDIYECRHGMSYTRFVAEKNELRSDLVQFIPLGSTTEVIKLTLENRSQSRKQLKLYSLIEWCLWNAEDDMTNFQRNFSTGEVEVEGSTIYHKTEFKERRNHYAFFHVNQAISGFDTDREQFMGLYNGFTNPQVVQNRKAKNTIAKGWSPIGSHELSLELAPGEIKEIIFQLGYVEVDENDKWESKGVINKAPAHKMIEEFNDEQKIEKALTDLEAYWEELLGSYQVKSEDPEVDRIVNIWNQYQCMVTFNMSRSASFFESGIGRGMGFRDSNQDFLGAVHMIPDRARERIIDIASTQFEDGSCYHQYQPLTKKGNAAIGGNFNDDPLWLILSTVAYIKETGDFQLLEEPVPFDHKADSGAVHFDHLKASFYHVVNNLGPHGLPLIGRADWNDCLNLNCFSKEPNESFQTTENQSGGVAESLMIAGLFVYAGKEFIELCDRVGKVDEARMAQQHIDQMTDNVIKYGWDGDWFLRAYDFYGNKIGSESNEEGKIFIESQAWCAMAEIGMDEGLVEKSLDAVKKHLDTEHGIVLNYPAFSKYEIAYGEISTYPAGYKENGGIFCHNNPWVMIAETFMGRGDRAYDYYRKICPGVQDERMELHKVEPYVYAQMIAGKEAVTPGQAKNSWLTGTASWNFYAISQFILGIQPSFDGLIIDPCLPTDWKEVHVKRRFRGVDYDIEILKPNGSCKGVKSVYLNDQKLEGNKIPIIEGPALQKVKVIM